MMRLKGCPRCQGDVLYGQDIYGRFRQCLQCGHLVDLGKPRAVVSKFAAGAYPCEEVA